MRQIRLRRSVLLLLIFIFSCGKQAIETNPVVELASLPTPISTDSLAFSKDIFDYHQVNREVTIRNYFEFLDTIVRYYDDLVSYPIHEHLLVRANPWLLDRLIATDYYLLMEQDSFIYDPQSIIILQPGDSLKIPGVKKVDELLEQLSLTTIDINIPEFRLRILEDDKVLYSFPVRVGRNEKKYLAMAGRKVDLRTHTGRGEVVRINKNPLFINPSDNRRYEVTRRDDGKLTKLPRVPWIELELDGRRYGQLIHPTTNSVTLGKAYSNGCIGTSEYAGWVIYYHAPIGTKVEVRYELEIVNEVGDTLLLEDIYPKRWQVAGIWEIAPNQVSTMGIGYCECR